jgi:uncharacterized protein
MVTQAIITGMALGFVGSFHCIGMCGPLALALPVQQLAAPQRLFAYLAYNMGRVATYSTLGFLLGLAGSGFVAAGLQQVFSIAMGSVVLLLALLHFVFKKQYQPRWWLRLNQQVQQWIAFFLKRRSKTGFFFMGMANGLLPCGMVYMAIATALVMGSAGTGALVMAGFGLATVPNMLLLGLIGSSISLPIRRAIKKTTPYMMIVVACLLILRGMNLGIPYISPAMTPPQDKQAVYCH